MTLRAPMPVDVAESVVTSQVKAQVRIGLAALAGVMVGKHLLPASMNNDTMLDAVCALIFGGLAAGWQWGRTVIEHSRWWHLAIDPRVPADLVRPDAEAMASALASAVPPPPHPSAAAPIDPTPEVPAPSQEHPMSIQTFLVQIEDTALADLKAAGTILESLFISETQKLVAQVKDTDIGTRAMNLIAAFENTSMTGAERMTTLLSLIGGDLAALAANGGLKGLVTSVENFAKEFCDSAYNDFKAVASKALGATDAPASAQPA